MTHVIEPARKHAEVLTASNCDGGTGGQTNPHNGSEVPYCGAEGYCCDQCRREERE